MPHLPFLSKDHEQRYDTPTPSHLLYMGLCREEEEPEAMEDAEDEKDSKPPVGEARSPGQAEFPKQQTGKATFQWRIQEPLLQTCLFVAS